MRAPIAVLLLLCACSVEVDVATPPATQAVPVTSYGVPVYAEVAVDLPEESQGDIITVTHVALRGQVVNPAQSTRMELELRLVSATDEGTATPETPFLFTQLNRPAYYQNAAVLLGPTVYAPGTSTPFAITDPALVAVVGQPRLWLIVRNTASATGLVGDPFPLELKLEDMVLEAQVVKSFEGLSGAQGVLGL
jgi:hypothetical protein